jgi:superfamily II DNA or RNA helicase
MLSKILDNSIPKYQLKTVIADFLKNDRITEVAIATGYWDLPGMVDIFEELSYFLSRDGVKFRLLLGEEPSVKAYQVANPEPIDPNFPQRYLKKDLEALELKPEFQKVCTLLQQYLPKDENGNAKLEIKVYKENFLHAKCYIFGSEQENSIGIIGSSNFTKQGLSGNLELNAVEDNNATVNYRRLNPEQHPSHRSWFEDLWSKSEDWNLKFNTEIIGLSKFGNLAYSPYEIYIRILYELYGDDIEIEEKLKLEDTFERKNTLTVFQQESVRKALNRLNDKKIGMCLVGDSVGLGKSYIARDIIERIGYYERKNVMIVCPASLRSDWQKHIDELNVNAMIYSITEFANDSSFEQIQNDLYKRKLNSKDDNAIHLLMIDESHNLKTQGSKSFQNLLQVITDRNFCTELPKVLMLSATPVNNGVKDLANQILLAKGGNERFFAHFGIENLLSLFGHTQREFKKRDSEEVFGELYPILNKIMVKRTKHQVKKDFPDALLNGKQIIFPEEKLVNELYELDNRSIRKSISEILTNLEKENEPLYDAFTIDLTEQQEEEVELKGVMDFFSSDAFINEKKRRINQAEFESVFHFIDRAIKNLKLTPYSYLSEKLERTEQEEIQANARKNLTGVMKVTLFKSFDSSIFTFNKRIEKYETYLCNFEELFFTHKKVVKPEIIQKAIARMEDEKDEDVLTLIFEEIESFREREQKKKDKDFAYRIQQPETAISLDAFNIENLKAFIKQDKDIISLMKKVVASIKPDTKLVKLKELLKELKGQKVLIFSYFATTVDYIRDHLGEDFLNEVGLSKDNTIAFLKSKNGKEKTGYVQRFSPIAQRQTIIDGKVNGKSELQVLVSTDVLSEGQNLQDCGIIINYDLHWNPVKMIQRNGRINRLGSVFNEVKIHNFLPEGQLERFLKLIKRLQDKIRIIGGSVGIDSSILGEQITDRQFGLLEDIYSNNTERQKLAIEDLERENDLAFDELFENDLREWIRKASDEEKEFIRGMNLNKWCGIPAFKDPEKLLVFNIGKGEFDFIRTDGNKVEKEPNQLKALRQIRSFDTERKMELISFDDKAKLVAIAQKLYDAESAYQATTEGIDLSEFMGVKSSAGSGSLATYKQELLNLLHENEDRYSLDNIKRLQNLLTSKNLAVDNRLRSYLKRYDNQVSIDFLDSIAILSVNLIKAEAPKQKPEPVMWYGYYPGE